MWRVGEDLITRMKRSGVIFLSVALGTTVGATVPQGEVLRLKVPLIRQHYAFCLIASVAMVTRYWGQPLTVEAIAENVPLYDEGTTGRDLVALVEQHGFRGFLIQPEFEDLLKHLRKGRPMIVGLPGPENTRHAVVVVGWQEGLLLFNDPAAETPTSLSESDFREQWALTHRWTFLIVPR